MYSTVFVMLNALKSATLAMLVLMATVVLAPATLSLPSTSKSTPELSLKVAGAKGEPSGHYFSSLFNVKHLTLELTEASSTLWSAFMLSPSLKVVVFLPHALWLTLISVPLKKSSLNIKV